MKKYIEDIRNWLKSFINIRLDMTVTISKIVGTLIIVLGYVLEKQYLDAGTPLNGLVFMSSLPIGAFLISGRWIKEVKSENNNLKSDLAKYEIDKLGEQVIKEK